MITNTYQQQLYIYNTLFNVYDNQFAINGYSLRTYYGCMNTPVHDTASDNSGVAWLCGCAHHLCRVLFTAISPRNRFIPFFSLPLSLSHSLFSHFNLYIHFANRTQFILLAINCLIHITFQSLHGKMIFRVHFHYHEVENILSAGKLIFPNTQVCRSQAFS